MNELTYSNVSNKEKVFIYKANRSLAGYSDSSKLSLSKLARRKGSRIAFCDVGSATMRHIKVRRITRCTVYIFTEAFINLLKSLLCQINLITYCYKLVMTAS